MRGTKTYSLSAKDIHKGWHVIDASGQTLGRLSTQVAGLLMGKHKPAYSRHLDMGDFVIIVNAAKLRVTGKKLDEEQRAPPGQRPRNRVRREPAAGRRPWQIRVRAPGRAATGLPALPARP